MTAPESIPLNKLIAWSGNVRKTAGADTALAELAASIAAHGLLQSLVVRRHKRGKYAVVAGARRLAALQKLAESGKIANDYAVSCSVIADDADATEISLVENTVREDMHPADEFEAFRDLIDKGMPATDVAARFGVTETVVLQRLKLARVSPVVIAAYRRDELSLAQVMAFAVSDDHAAQEHLLENLSEYDRDPGTIRDALTGHEIAATDRRVRFVTLESYRIAGGTVRRDLFAEGDNGLFILDEDLLDRLVASQLEAARVALQSEGWKWVEARPVFDHAEWSGCQRVYAEPAPLTPAQDAELALLGEEYNRLGELDDLDEQAEARLDEVSGRIDELENGETFFTPDNLAMAGAIVCIDHDGEIGIKRGFVRPGDAPKQTRSKAAEQAGGDDAGGDQAPKPALSSDLVESLTAQRSAAISAALTERPDVALAAVVYTLAQQTVFGRYSKETSLSLTGIPRSFRRVEGSKALEAIERHRDNWGEHIPGDRDAAWEWCLSQSRDVLLDLLALCAACLVDAVREKKDRPDDGRLTHADALATALGLDMTAWFTPTADNFFSRISKPQILTSLQEARTTLAPAWSSLKKAELATLAERETAGTGWLPELLRNPA